MDSVQQEDKLDEIDKFQTKPLKDPVIEPRPLKITNKIQNLNDKQRKEIRKGLRQEYTRYQEEKSLKYKRILDNLFKLNTQNTNRVNNNLLKILANKDFLINCFETLKSNKGILTPGTDENTIDEIDVKVFEKLSTSLLDGTYKFQKARRIYVDKPGKTKKRPITIPNTEDRIVQEGIRVILNCIYEPLFEKQNSNYGFRPKKEISQAMERIKLEAKNMEYAIEGDIEGAYDNVDHNVMIGTLRKKIADNKFIRLISQLHKAGIMEGGISKETTLGIPQGGIASPILFNIYMHSLDEYISKTLNEMDEEINKKEGRSSAKIRSKLYIRADKKLLKLTKALRDEYENRNIKSLKGLNPKIKASIREKSKEMKKVKSYKSKIKSQPSHRIPLRNLYLRYADDFIVLTNGNKDYACQIKDLIAKYLQENLKEKLSEDKTEITYLRKKKAKFLGYTIKNNQDKAIMIKVVQKSGKVFKQRASWNLFIDIDHERVEKRLQLKGILDKKLRPKRYTLLEQLQDHEIVTRFRLMIEGLFNYYYRSVTFKSTLGRYYYYLLYSCYHTLAARKKMSIRNLIKTFTKTLRIKYTIKVKENNQIKELEKTTLIPTYNKTLMTTMKRMSIVGEQESKDFLSIKVNLRSSFKFIKYCAICGATPTKTNPIQSHHVRHIRKGRNTNFTEEIMRRLGKRQIICCKTCHNRIHNGTYNNLSLNDVYDAELLRI